ncbi:MAG: RidA family protein [Myxococcales bacterium]|nr:RidA family protein [Myxococcales bacterium]
MSHRIVDTAEAPKAIGPYSQAVVHGGLVFCSGQIPLDPATGEIVGGGDVRLEVEQVMKNLRAVLEAAGSDLEHVLKATIFVTDLAHFATVNEVYGAHVSRERPPARATVQVAALPRGAQVEIEVVAAVK